MPIEVGGEPAHLRTGSARCALRWDLKGSTLVARSSASENWEGIWARIQKGVGGSPRPFAIQEARGFRPSPGHTSSPAQPPGKRAWNSRWEEGGGRGASRDSRVAAIVRLLAISVENLCYDLTSGGSDSQTQMGAFLAPGTHSFINALSIKVTLPAGCGAGMGEGDVAGEDTKMTALEERRASRLFSLPSPQVRLASLQPEA